jgi:cation diffusion facilitator family transporter
MHQLERAAWQHRHDFVPDDDTGERRARWVVSLTATAMVAEIAAGYAFGSMALLADGWHMASHAGALLLTALACAYARRARGDERWSFGPGKVSSLAGFASGVALAMVALFMMVESIQRLAVPLPVRYSEALLVAVVGLGVNLTSVLLLSPHHHDHDHHEHHEHGEGGHAHHDHNLRAAYLHVLADSMTSVLAIVALLAGRYLGWRWLDPIMGIAGAILIARWCIGLLRDTSAVLLDRARPDELTALRSAVEEDGDSKVVDLHLWDLSAGRRAAIVSVVTHGERSPAEYKARLEHMPRLVHVTVEVHRCPGPAECAPAAG